MKFKSEAELAAVVMRRMKAIGWDCFAEVQLDQASKRADLICTSGRKVMVIETKLSLSIDVVSQAMLWLGQAHFIVIAVPAPTQRSAQRISFITDYLRSKGIGLWWITPGEVFEHKTLGRYEHSRLDVVVPEKLHRYADWNSRKIHAVLVDEMREAIAGSKVGGEASTTFKRTCLELSKFVAKYPGVGFNEAFQHIDHHYSSVRSARSNLEFIAKTADLDFRSGRLFPRGFVEDVPAPKLPPAPKKVVAGPTYADTNVIRCGDCHGALAILKHHCVGMALLPVVKERMEENGDYSEWEKSSEMPPIKMCGCSRRKPSLLSYGDIKR